jgi:hypothetical protein
MKITKEQIDTFLDGKKMAMAGVSRNPKKFGYQIFDELTKKGFMVYPVNPEADEINGVTSFKDIASLPDDVENLFIVTPKEQTGKVIEEAAKRGIKKIWIQQMSDTPEALEIAKEAQMDVIHGKCMMMFAQPVKGVHKFHRGLVSLFGRLPK